MLLKTSQLRNLPVMSLQTGEEVARTAQLLISPDTLKIVGFELSGKHLTAVPSFLRIEDIRELSNIGFIVDSSDEFIELDDVIAIRDIYDLQFQLDGMRVIDMKGKKIGKVYDSIFASDTFTIEQLCVSRPLFQSFDDTELLIHKRQIIEINRDTIIVRTPTVRTGDTRMQRTEPTVLFRSHHPQPETISQDSQSS